MPTPSDRSTCITSPARSLLGKNLFLEQSSGGKSSTVLHFLFYGDHYGDHKSTASLLQSHESLPGARKVPSFPRLRPGLSVHLMIRLSLKASRHHLTHHGVCISRPSFLPRVSCMPGSVWVDNGDAWPFGSRSIVFPSSLICLEALMLPRRADDTPISSTGVRLSTVVPYSRSCGSSCSGSHGSVALVSSFVFWVLRRDTLLCLVAV